MDAREFCEVVERKNLERRRLSRAVPVEDDHSPLVSLRDIQCKLVFEPSIVKNYEYLVREAVFEKVERISRRLEKKGRLLIIRSAWRSFAHQRMIWDARVAQLEEENPEIHSSEIYDMASYFIAPETRSMHSTGGAVDALMYDVEGDCVVDFGTNHGLAIDLGRRCYPGHPAVPVDAARNRNVMNEQFEAEGFVCDLKEFWHFDYGNVIWAAARNEDHAIYGVIER